MSERQFKLPVAVHSTLDDANLSAEEFRVMAHICRRCGDEENGRHCDSAIGTMAKICRLHPDTVRKAIARLVELKWVSIIDRPGRTKVHVAHFPNPSGLKVGAGPEGGGMVWREGYGLDVAPPTGFKGGPHRVSRETKGYQESNSGRLFSTAVPVGRIQGSVERLEATSDREAETDHAPFGQEITFGTFGDGRGPRNRCYQSQHRERMAGNL